MKQLVRFGVLFAGACVLALPNLRGASPAVVKVPVANLRAQPSASADILARLKAGETLQVVGQVPEADKPSGPARWAKVELPNTMSIWIATSLVDEATGTVKATFANLRAGPGRNYNQLGRLQNGTKVEVIKTADGWMEIKGPPGIFGYVASELLDLSPKPAGVAGTSAPSARPAPVGGVTQAPPPPSTTPRTVPPPTSTATRQSASPHQPPLSVPSTVPPGASLPKPPPSTAALAPAPALAPEAAAPLPAKPVESQRTTSPPPGATYAANQVPGATNTADQTAALKPVTTPAAGPTTVASAPRPDAPPSTATIPPPQPGVSTNGQAGRRIDSITTEYQPAKRVITREGVVNYTMSPLAPTVYELLSPRKGEFGVINFMLPADPTFELKKFYGKRVYATGEEWVDERWPKTPILRVQHIDLVW